MFLCHYASVLLLLLLLVLSIMWKNRSYKSLCSHNDTGSCFTKQNQLNVTSEMSSLFIFHILWLRWSPANEQVPPAFPGVCNWGGQVESTMADIKYLCITEMRQWNAHRLRVNRLGERSSIFESERSKCDGKVILIEVWNFWFVGSNQLNFSGFKCLWAKGRNKVSYYSELKVFYQHSMEEECKLCEIDPFLSTWIIMTLYCFNET